MHDCRIVASSEYVAVLVQARGIMGGVVKVNFCKGQKPNSDRPRIVRPELLFEAIREQEEDLVSPKMTHVYSRQSAYTTNPIEIILASTSSNRAVYDKIHHFVQKDNQNENEIKI